MPRDACRIILEITDVCVERLNQITEEDANAEGVLFYGDDDPEQTDYKNYMYDDVYGDDWGVSTAKESFETLWESINGVESLKANPYVWVIQFKVVEP